MSHPLDSSDHARVSSSSGSSALDDSGLADPGLRRTLTHLARRGVPAQEADDIVQEALTEALAARAHLHEPRNLRNWLWGVVRHKTVDFHRRAGREQAADPPEATVEPDEGAGRELLRWAETNLPGNRCDQQTFEWLLREGDGEKLEEIARSEEMPAERVRQRVARLRRYFREKWAAELAIALAAALLAVVVWGALRPSQEPIATPEDHPAPLRVVTPDAKQLRQEALERCAAGDAVGCIDGLDRAARLDPEGDRSDEVQRARREARPSPAPPPSASAPAQGASRFGKVTTGRTASDTSPRGRCVCPKGDPLCGCF